MFLVGENVVPHKRGTPLLTVFIVINVLCDFIMF